MPVPLELLVKSMFEHSDFTIAEHPKLKLTRAVNALKKKYGDELEKIPFSGKRKEEFSECANDILNTFEYQDNVATGYSLFHNEDWYEDLNINVIRGKVKLRSGSEKIPSPALEGVRADYIGIILYLTEKLGYKKDDVFQEVAEYLGVQGWDEEASSCRSGQKRSKGAEKVRGWFNGKDKRRADKWSNEGYHPYSNQKEIKK